MVMSLAKGDWDKVQRILRWPVRAALWAFVEEQRAIAIEGYRHEFLCFVIAKGAGAKDYPEPKLPEILR